MNLKYIFRFTAVVMFFHAIVCQAQERVGPVMYNPFVKSSSKLNFQAISKTTALSLPFFDDFSGYSPLPDSQIWADFCVYINNTMCDSPISRGVATFDGLNSNGIPYDPVSSGTLLYADSLTSRLIDLSSYTAADSIYLSFFYQPQGHGFYPEESDSLMLFFKRKNKKGWAKVWAREGSKLQPFKQVMVPVTDTSFFYDEFQFRFINQASMNTNDDIWNLDYVRMAANRSITDTAVNDIAFMEDPGFMLDDYTYMPYSHFMADPGAERATQHQTSVRNNTGNNVTLTYGLTAEEKLTNTILYNGINNIGVPPNKIQSVIFTTYTNTVPASNENAIFENKYYFQAVPGAGPTANDTIIREQIFHNFFAYDDGTAEKSYYLNQFSSLPGKTAVEYHLNHDDTLKAVGIYFGRQVPLATYKYFSIAVYKDIGYQTGNEQLLYQEDYLDPGFLAVNHFYVYKLTQPVPLKKGTFFVGTIQPALSSSDSLYIGLDDNRIGGNHLYFNVEGYWEASAVHGAVMIRPMFGTVFSSGVENVTIKPGTVDWSVSPHPVSNQLTFNYNSNEQAEYDIYDMQGVKVKHGTVMAFNAVDVGDLAAGIYIVHLNLHGYISQPRKIIKL